MLCIDTHHTFMHTTLEGIFVTLYKGSPLLFLILIDLCVYIDILILSQRRCQAAEKNKRQLFGCQFSFTFHQSNCFRLYFNKGSCLSDLIKIGSPFIRDTKFHISHCVSMHFAPMIIQDSISILVEVYEIWPYHIISFFTGYGMLRCIVLADIMHHQKMKQKMARN